MADNWWEEAPEDNDWWRGAPEEEFPGMPQSLRPDAPQDFTKPPAVGGTLQQIAEFQKNYRSGAPEPPFLLQRDPAVERDRGLDDPQSPEFQALRERAMMKGTADAAGPSLSILGSTAALGMLPAALAMRGGGALIGGTEGYRKGGVPGALAGAAVGAVKPGLTGTVGGALQGYELGGIKGALLGGGLGMLMGGGRGQLAREMGRGGGAVAAETLPARVAAARETAAISSAVPAEKKAIIEASRAAREAKATEAVAKARPQAPVEPVPARPPEPEFIADDAVSVAPYRSDRGETYEQMMERFKAERAARMAEYDQRIAAERKALDPQFLPDDSVSIAPEPQFIADDALALVADPIPPRIRRPTPKGIVTVPYGGGAAPLPAGQRTMPTNLGGKAKAVPPPTKPEDLEATLKASIEKEQIKQALKGAETPIDPASLAELEATAGQTEKVADLRKTLGSEKVARQMGMDRGQVQRDAGVITDEALGEVSKLIPTKAWEKIVQKAMSLPPEARPAYIAKMHGGKNLAQGEALLRTLKAAGLMIPIGVAGAAMGNER